MGAVYQLTNGILWVLWLAAMAGTIFALVHAVRQRKDAFPAVDKLTKPIWVSILAVALGLLVVAGTAVGLLGIISVVATGIYLADVRPKVDEIQRGPRW
ncbi:DUF2516 family protein [Nocardia vermiculata]|uniref:DUF2516 family protein n=1 Tax=Nocardia vermiculata TaxID=257274 RepID=A0A846YBB1_9NOCA|nr:DUF2516 family protein [Nocardia vermiculata]NKY54069.1 DUF2516 family protein [Nocardia vermiculata]